MTWYLIVRHDADYSRSTPTAPLLQHFRTFPELVALGPIEFRNAHGSLWASLILALADMSGNYTVDGAFHPSVNIVELICGDGNEEVV